MIEQDFNEKIINSIRRYTPYNINLSEILKDVLSLGREAIYRRLRGEVPFTIPEVIKICRAFNLSMDSMLEIEQTSKALFDISIYAQHANAESYIQAAENFINEIIKFRNIPGNYSIEALNIIPFSFYISLENISKFSLFKWKYLMNNGYFNNTLPEIIIPESITEIHKKLIRELLLIEKTTILLSPNIFKSFINDIKYFTRMNFIPETIFSSLKEELETMMSELEYITINGKYRNGNNVLVYLSNIDFETSYSFYNSGDSEYANIRLCLLNNISTCDTHICELLKNWLNAMKKTATLITLSGDIQRRSFFDEHRELINAMDYRLFHN